MKGIRTAFGILRPARDKVITLTPLAEHLSYQLIEQDETAPSISEREQSYVVHSSLPPGTDAQEMYSRRVWCRSSPSVRL